MAISPVTVTVDFNDFLGTDFDPATARLVLATNVASGWIVDTTTGGTFRVGGARITPDASGVATASVLPSGATGLEPTEYQIRFTIEATNPATRKKVTVDLGWYTITATCNLKDEVDEQYVAPTYMTTAQATLQGYVDEGEDIRDETQAIRDGIVGDLGTTDSQTATLINSPGSLTETALSASIEEELIPPSQHLAPLFVSTSELAGCRLAAPGARSGLSSATVTVVAGDGTSAAQGYANERIATGVSGTKGAYTLTVTDTATLATLDGAGSTAWDAAVLNSDGQAITVTVLDVSGSTVTLLRKLPITITGGQLASRMDEASGQHLTTIGYRALAQHIAAINPVVGTRGGIIEGQWDTTPPSYRTIWARNAALISYGVSNSAAPIVQSSLLAQTSANVYDTNDILRRPNAAAGGVMVGCHTTGHGATATIRTGRRPVVVEFNTCAERTNIVTTARVRVTATSPDGIVIYDETVDGSMAWHRIPVTGLDYVTVDVADTDGGIYYLHLSQLMVREAGTGGPLRPKKALLLGDSWTQFYGHVLGDYLGDALGCEVVTFGKGGTTTDWGVAWLDEALATAPDVDTVILHFYTNDLNNNQSSTMTIPGGSTVSMWPNGLTTAQAQARWVTQIRKLISLVQRRGLRPVVVMPGTVNVTTQLDAAIHLEQPRLIDWSATTAELADTTAYVNVVGKTQGTAVRVGSSVKYATGSSASASWANPAEDALEPLQKRALSRATYEVSTGVTIGTDSNADGLSDGFATAGYGTTTGDTYTGSIVAGNQRYATSYAASGASGNLRLRANFNVTSGRDYLVVWDLINATPSSSLADSVSDITGSAVGISASNGSITTDASGNGLVCYRATANATGAKYSAIQFGRVNGATRTFDVRKHYVIDLTALFIDAPNLASKSTTELAAFVVAMAA